MSSDSLEEEEEMGIRRGMDVRWELPSDTGHPLLSGWLGWLWGRCGAQHMQGMGKENWSSPTPTPSLHLHYRQECILMTQLRLSLQRWL